MGVLGILKPNADKNLLFSDAEYWIGDRIFQEYHFGYEGDNKENPVLWGFCFFGFTGLPDPNGDKTLPPSTGYQHVENFLCLGTYDFALAEARKNFADITIKGARGGGSGHTPVPEAERTDA